MRKNILAPAPIVCEGKRASEFVNCFRGYPGVVLGNSPSIGMVNLKLLDPFISIGVNRILRAYSSHFVMFCDTRIPIEEESDFKRYAGRFLIYDKLRSWKGKLSSEDNVYFWSLNGKKGRGDSAVTGTDTFYTCGTTPGYAIQLMQYWGMNPIAVLGVDFNAPQLGSKNKDSHFYGEGKKFKSNGGGNFD